MAKHWNFSHRLPERAHAPRHRHNGPQLRAFLRPLAPLLACREGGGGFRRGYSVASRTVVHVRMMIVAESRNGQSIHAEKSFQNIIESTRNQIVFTIFRLILIQTESVRLDRNQFENGKYNLIWG